METLTEAFSDRLESEVAQFEVNAALWRLEADRHLHRLREDSAVCVLQPDHAEAARIALEGIRYEIDRLQAFAREHPGMPEASVLRLAELGLALETARRRLERAFTE